MAAALLASSFSPAWSSTPADPLAGGFADPPSSARPRVWWHWMNGNVTEDGILKDMQWMERVGIGGLQNFDANLATPQIVDHRLIYMHPDWKDAFAFAARTADQLGLELAIASSPGWSETGGPWVKPRDGLKKLVWSETLVTGPTRFNGKLVHPPIVTGAFQNLRWRDPVASNAPPPATNPPAYYSDVSVLAVPASGIDEVPAYYSGGKRLNGRLLSDNDLETSVPVARGSAKRPTIVSLNYKRPQHVQSATIFLFAEASPISGGQFAPTLEARVNGRWDRVAVLPLTAVPTTVSFPPEVARNFRVVLEPAPGTAWIGIRAVAPGAASVNFFTAPPPSKPVKIGELRLSSEPKIDQFETKAGFAIAEDYYALSKGVPDLAGVDPDRVINLTPLLRGDGSIDWTPPKGNWRIIRIGYSLVGTTNHPATPEATGLEVDKFDGTAVRNYLETYLAMYRDASGGLLGKKGVRALMTDSIEIGAANWTPQMIEQFKNLRGYDPTPWLPTLTGTIIGSRDRSDKFLYDFRRTLADLISSQHYGTIAAVAHENQLRLYGEALEEGRPALGDDMAMRRYADVPTAALWSWNRESNPLPTLIGDMKGAASVAHIYGQNLAAAESMTSANAPWAFAPSDLRRIIDFEFAMGINQPIIHTSVHQPTDDKLPGLSLSIFGQYFNRHETWAEMARPWIDYIARNSFMLQQGRNVADVAYFYGEETPLTALFAHSLPPDMPRRYAYDFVNTDVLINQLNVDHGELVAKTGARYRALYLGGTSIRMTVPVLRRLVALVDAGATVIGTAPTSSPSLNDNLAQFAELRQKLWSGRPITTYGKGRVIAHRQLDAAMSSTGTLPDFNFARSKPDSEILFVHRRIGDGDIYYVDNRRDRPESIEAQFRVTGKAPEIWHADTGASELASYGIKNGFTEVPLEMGPEESFFVVFRNPTSVLSQTIRKPVLKPIAELPGPWSIAFQPDRGAPVSVILPALASLSENADPGIKYFSGTATYANNFELPAGAQPGAPLWLDLGKIGDIAEIWINGEPIGITWHAPYRLNISKAVHKGMNQLEVRVTDLWVNRLIGDAQPGAHKIAWTALPTYRPDAPIRFSGLGGPVTLEAESP
jgi:hypothetical protein